MTLYNKHLAAIQENIELSVNLTGPLERVSILGQKFAAKACEQITLDEMEKVLNWMQEEMGEEGDIVDRWYNNQKSAKHVIKAYYERDKSS